ncbi:MAG TPA: hypothetical protein VM076_03560 [Gemmatimonadaceae bacterium]|nr:hypothetical protein [Gemmatimonadaceae bacterium]
MTDRHSSVIAAAAMAAMFAVGMAFGIALDHRVLHRRPPGLGFGMDRRPDGGPVFMPGAMPRGGRPPSPSAVRGGGERALDAFARELELTPAQLAVAHSILRHEFETVNGIREETWPRMQAVMDDTRRKIDSVLSPTQRDRYHDMLAEQQRRFRPRDGDRPAFSSHER